MRPDHMLVLFLIVWLIEWPRLKTSSWIVVVGSKRFNSHDPLSSKCTVSIKGVFLFILQLQSEKDTWPTHKPTSMTHDPPQPTCLLSFSMTSTHHKTILPSAKLFSHHRYLLSCVSPSSASSSVIIIFSGLCAFENEVPPIRENFLLWLHIFWNGIPWEKYWSSIALFGFASRFLEWKTYWCSEKLY